MSARAWIATLPDADATGELRELYDRVRDRRGHVDHILLIHGLDPPALLAHYDLYRVAMRGSATLTRTQRELVAVVVSAANRCEY